MVAILNINIRVLFLGTKSSVSKKKSDDGDDAEGEEQNDDE